MAVSLAITNLRAAERDAVFRQNLKRLGGQPCIGLTLIDEKPGLQMLVYDLGRFDHCADSNAGPKIGRRWDHWHKPEISNQQCALGYGRDGRGRTVNDDEVVIANELLHLAVELSVGIGQTGDAGREGGFIGRRIGAILHAKAVSASAGRVCD